METKYGTADVEEDEEVGKGGVALGGNSFKDISDFKNDECVPKSFPRSFPATIADAFSSFCRFVYLL